MTAIHLEPHPLAGQYIKPGNEAIRQKFGDRIRVEDWQDRITGHPWRNTLGQNPEAQRYHSDRIQLYATDKTMSRPAVEDDTADEVVRCHDENGDVVLLHDAWLKEAANGGEQHAENPKLG